MRDNVYRLIDAVCEAYDYALEHYRPIPDNPATPENERKTFCNLVVQRVCRNRGYTQFAGMLANDMIDFMGSSPDWLEVGHDTALTLVGAGELVIAGRKKVPHGHVVVCRPGVASFSQKWGGVFVPKCMNVGAKVSISLGVNFAFEEAPKYFLLRGTHELADAENSGVERKETNG